MTDLGLTVNPLRMQAMKFRRTSSTAASDTLYLSNCFLPVNLCPCSKFLVSANGRNFMMNVVKDAKEYAKVSALWMVKSLHFSTLTTVFTLFDLKLAPITTYKIQIIWEDLTVEKVEQFSVRAHTSKPPF